MERTIELPGDQLSQLERLAAREHRSVDELVQFAVGDYLARRTRDWSEWGRRFDELVARVRAHVPADVTSEEIEADITLARDEVRAEMRREAEQARGDPGSRGTGGASGAGGR